MKPRGYMLAGLLSLSLGSLGVAFVHACGGQAGNPAAPEPVMSSGAGPADATVATDAADARVAAKQVSLSATVSDLTTAAPVPNVLVVVEVGGLNQPNPSAGTFGGNPLFQYGGLTNDAGVVEISVQAGPVGLHAFADGDYEATGGVWDAGLDAGQLFIRSLSALPEAGATLRPQAHGVTANPSTAAPGAPIIFTVIVDPPANGALSDEILLVSPVQGLAWALDAPTLPPVSGPYPQGIYSRIVAAPTTLGTYPYDLVVGAIAGAVSNRVTVMVTVTSDGLPPIPDAGGDGAEGADAG